MPLAPGTRLGPYEIVAPLGAGGMGEVYRARDTRSARDVAIKALPQAFAADPERLARFRREAQTLASLNHPNIAAIYGLEEVDGAPYLVLELVEGETLAARLARGALTLREGARARRPDRGRDRGGARARRRPPRPEARQRHDHAGERRQGARLRARQERAGAGPGTRPLGVAHADGARRRHGGGHDPGHRRLHEPRAGARPARWTAAATCGRSAACCTSASPAGRRSPARRSRT